MFCYIFSLKVLKNLNLHCILLMIIVMLFTEIGTLGPVNVQTSLLNPAHID